MKNTENSRSLLATLWSGFLIFLCGFLANTVIGFVYGTMIGLQTRGDVAVISAKMQMFTSSPMFYGLLLLVVCVVAFWRGRVMGRRFDRRTAAKNIVLAVVLGMLLRTIVLQIGKGADVGPGTMAGRRVVVGIANRNLGNKECPEK